MRHGARYSDYWDDRRERRPREDYHSRQRERLKDDYRSNHDLRENVRRYTDHRPSSWDSSEYDRRPSRSSSDRYSEYRLSYRGSEVGLDYEEGRGPRHALRKVAGQWSSWEDHAPRRTGRGWPEIREGWDRESRRTSEERTRDSTLKARWAGDTRANDPPRLGSRKRPFESIESVDDKTYAKEHLRARRESLSGSRSPRTNWSTSSQRSRTARVLSIWPGAVAQLKSIATKFQAIVETFKVVSDPSTGFQHALVEFPTWSLCNSFVNNSQYGKGRIQIQGQWLAVEFTEDESPAKKTGGGVDLLIWLCHECWSTNEGAGVRCENCQRSRKKDSTWITAKGQPCIPSMRIVAPTATNIDLFSNAVLVLEDVYSQTQEEVIHREMSKLGRVKGVHIVFDEQGVSTGSAYVQFSSVAEASRIQLRYPLLMLDKCQIKLSRITSSKEPLSVTKEPAEPKELLRKVASNITETAKWGSQNGLKMPDSSKTSESSKIGEAIEAAKKLWAKKTKNKSGPVATNGQQVDGKTIDLTEEQREKFPSPEQYGLDSRFEWRSEHQCFKDEESGFYYDIHRKLYFFENQYYDFDEVQMKYVVIEDVDNYVPGSKKVEETKPKEPDKPIKFAFSKKLSKKQAAAFAAVAKKPVLGGIIPSKAPEEGYIDLKRLCCLLCKRKFKTIEQLQKHELHSKLHKTNLEAKRQERTAPKLTAPKPVATARTVPRRRRSPISELL